MINWEYHNIKIDNNARLQFEHYFNDIKSILEKQNLLFKEQEILTDLEDHIIDYIRNKNITVISFKEAMEILTDLGPPDEYTDFSTMPGLIDEISKKKKSNKSNFSPNLKNNTSNIKDTELILCPNCNTKNEQDSAFCINCGVKFIQKEFYPILYRKSITQLFLTNPIFFFSWLSLFILAIYFVVTQSNYASSLLMLEIFFINELVIIPLFFIIQLLYNKEARFDLFAFFYSYVAKYASLIILIASIESIVYIFGDSMSFADLISSLEAIILPFIFTWFIYFSDYTIKLQNAQNTKPNIKNLVTYLLVEGALFFSMLFLLFSPPNSPSLIIIIILSTIAILLTYLVYDYHNSLNTQKIENPLDMNHKNTKSLANIKSMNLKI